MNFIAVHRYKKDAPGRDVIYIHSQSICMIESGVDQAGSRVTLTTGEKVDLWEIADDLIIKIKGFTKPKITAVTDIASIDKLPSFADNPRE